MHPEAQALWTQLQQNPDQILGTPLYSHALSGRRSGKLFTPTDFKDDRLYLKIEGRERSPKHPPSLRPSDFEAYLLFKAGQITQEAAMTLSFRTAYAGPIIDRLKALQPPPTPAEAPPQT